MKKLILSLLHAVKSLRLARCQQATETETLDQDPICLLAVNAAFLTPISTPLNLLVYGPGGYSATDYLRIGLPVKLAYLAISIIVICLIYGI